MNMNYMIFGMFYFNKTYPKQGTMTGVIATTKNNINLHNRPLNSVIYITSSIVCMFVDGILAHLLLLARLSSVIWTWTIWFLGCSILTKPNFVITVVDVCTFVNHYDIIVVYVSYNISRKSVSCILSCISYTYMYVLLWFIPSNPPFNASESNPLSFPGGQ